MVLSTHLSFDDNTRDTCSRTASLRFRFASLRIWVDLLSFSTSFLFWRLASRHKKVTVMARSVFWDGVSVLEVREDSACLSGTGCLLEYLLHAAWLLTGVSQLSFLVACGPAGDR